MLLTLPALDECLPRKTDSAKHKRGDAIYMGSADGIYYVSSGIVRVFRVLESGRRLHVDFYRAGECFGETSLLRNSVQEVAVPFTPVAEVCHWRRRELPELFAARPELIAALVGVYEARAQELLRRVGTSEHLVTLERLVAALLHTGRKIGRRDERNDTALLVEPSIPHEVIASMVGTSREIVTHYMTQLKRKGAVRYNRRQLVVYTTALEHAAAESAANRRGERGKGAAA